MPRRNIGGPDLQIVRTETVSASNTAPNLLGAVHKGLPDSMPAPQSAKIDIGKSAGEQANRNPDLKKRVRWRDVASRHVCSLAAEAVSKQKMHAT
jgi:hypothetical protein